MELIEIWRYSPPNAAPAPEKLFVTPPPKPGKPKPGLTIKPNILWTLDGWDVDGPNTQFFFIWKSISPPPSPGPFQKTDDTPGAVYGGGIPSLETLGYNKVEVRVNGQVVPLVGQYGLQFGPGGTIITRPLLDARPQAWPISVSMQAETNQGKHVYSATSKVQVGKIWSWFERTLWPIFTHARCTSCHSVGDHNAIVKYHKDRNVQGVDSQDPNWKPHNPEFCVGCHGIVTNEWFSPAFVQGVNWTGAMPPAKNICEKVTGPFTNKNGQVGPPLDLHYHFHNDPRIIWAVSDGTVPMGHPKKPVLFPGKKEEFFYRIDEWLNKGKPCPKTTAMDGQ